MNYHVWKTDDTATRRVIAADCPQRAGCTFAYLYLGKGRYSVTVSDNQGPSPFPCRAHVLTVEVGRKNDDHKPLPQIVVLYPNTED